MWRRGGRRGEHVQGALDAGRQHEWPLLQVDLAGLDLREVEDVVDDREQRVAGGLDRVGVVALLVGRAGVSMSRSLIPMIAFIGVRISWLIAARNVLLAWSARLGRFRRRPGVAVQAGVLEGDRGVLRQADEQVEVARAEGRCVARAPDGHRAEHRLAGDEGGGHQPLLDVGLGARDGDRARVVQGVVDDDRLPLGDGAADDALAGLDQRRPGAPPPARPGR